jgi:hypothetical protein
LEDLDFAEIATPEDFACLVEHGCGNAWLAVWSNAGHGYRLKNKVG